MSSWFRPGPVRDRESQSGESATFRYAVDAMQGWRDSMEDAHIVAVKLPSFPDVSMFAVMDGHGGSAVARFCQEYLLGVVDEHLQREGSMEAALRAAFHAIDDMLRDRKHSRFLRHNNGSGVRAALLSKLMLSAPVADEAGCTALVALLKGNSLWVANVGDSRGVLCRSGKVVELSKDHKPYMEKEQERITKAGGWVHDGRMRDARVCGELTLSRALGDLKFKKDKMRSPEEQIITAEPDIFRFDLTTEDSFFVLACDGIWDVLSNREVVEFVQKQLAEGATLAQATTALLDRCLAQHPNSQGIGCDNMTAVIVQLNTQQQW